MALRFRNDYIRKTRPAAFREQSPDIQVGNTTCTVETSQLEQYLSWIVVDASQRCNTHGYTYNTFNPDNADSLATHQAIVSQVNALRDEFTQRVQDLGQSHSCQEIFGTSQSSPSSSPHQGLVDQVAKELSNKVICNKAPQFQPNARR